MTKKEKNDLIEFWDLWLECIEYAKSKTAEGFLHLPNMIMVTAYALHVFEHRKAKKEAAK